jgi:hypothetical protein
MKSTALLAVIVASAAMTLSAPAEARKSCDDVKADIEAKLKAKGVAKYTLEVVDKDAEVKDGKVIGTCDGNTKKIVYKRG